MLQTDSHLPYSNITFSSLEKNNHHLGWPPYSGVQMVWKVIRKKSQNLKGHEARLN